MSPAPNNFRRLPPRSVEQPETGWFLMRLVRGGPMVPAAIRCTNGFWQAEINGVLQGDPERNPLLAPKVFDVWLSWRERLTERQYNERLVRFRSPEALDPAKPIDLNAMDPIQF